MRSLLVVMGDQNLLYKPSIFFGIAWLIRDALLNETLTLGFRFWWFCLAWCLLLLSVNVYILGCKLDCCPFMPWKSILWSWIYYGLWCWFVEVGWEGKSWCRCTLGFLFKNSMFVLTWSCCYYLFIWLLWIVVDVGELIHTWWLHDHALLVRIWITLLFVYGRLCLLYGLQIVS